MKIRDCLWIVALAGSGVAASAQTTPPIDCSDPANAEAEACLDLPDPGATNLVPLVAPVAGLLAVGALASGGSSSSTTTTSTSTTGTN